MRGQRAVIDYALARRAQLADLFAGRISTRDACDAHPYLLRAARHHGEDTGVRCPVCRRRDLTHVTYVYGDALRESAGRAVATASLAGVAERFGEVSVYVVEVCQECGWNHLVTSYILGAVGERARPARAGRSAPAQR